MAERVKPADQAVRDRIKDDLDKTLFVEAGAGTGKTTSLVSRIISLIIGPKRVPITQIAAITFTEKAAIELRNRVRAEINKYLTDPQELAGPELAGKGNGAAVAGAAGGDELVALLSEALAGLDSAPISTLHGFARRLLDEHPLEAGLPPAFEVLDEIGSQVDFDTSWSAFVEQMLSDESNRDWLLKIDRFAVSVNHMQALALKFTDNWDLLNWPPYKGASASGVGGNGASGVGGSGDSAKVFEEIATRAQHLYDQRDQCEDPDDRLYAKFEVLPEFVRRLKACRNDLERLTLLTNGQYVVPKVGNMGRKDNWPSVADLRDQFRILRTICDRYLAKEASDAVHSCVEQLRRFALQLAKERQSAGRLSFQDLLVVCRNLLRSKEHGATVRQALHRRYSHLLLDEFHDTDPIQIEIATLIASPVAASDTGRTVPDGSPSNGLVGDWVDLAADDGHLFFVGDPKQSIYRFRRADIKLYHKAQERFGEQLGETLNLGVNFRSSKPIIDWVNHVFEWLMYDRFSYEDLPDGVFASEGEAKQAIEGLRASYTSLKAVRAAPETGPAVTFLGTEPHEEKSTAEVRSSEAKDIAGAIVNICKKEWTVLDRTSGKERSARLDDITILLPTRTALPSLEDALQERHIPYRLESTSFVWSNRVIRDLMMCLRAIADPTNELATVSALRSAIYGCGDDDLFRHKVINGGSWDYRTATSSCVVTGAGSAQSDPVVAALAHLNQLHDLSAYQTPAELIEQLVLDRQVLEQATAWPGVREQWRHVRFLVDQARAWSESQQSGLRRFLLWANDQSSDNARVTVPVLPELDDEAVHVMTMHASKGLEFPIVILAGLQETVRKESEASSVVFVSKDESPAVRFVGDAKSANYDKWSEVEVLAGHYERIRRLYVACTRARDHLVISAHRKQAESSTLQGTTSAQLLIEASEPASGQDPGFEVSDFSARGSLPAKFLAPAKLSSKRPELEQWEQNRNRSLAASKKAAWLSASRIAKRPSSAADNGAVNGSAANNSAADRDGAAEDTEDAEGSATNRSRYGGATFGSAVHGVLEKINLAAAVKAVANAAANAATNAAAGTDGDSQADPEAGSEAESEADREINTKITNLSKSQAEEKGVPGLAKEVKQRVRKVLAHPTVQAAVQARHWQEVYVGALAGTQDHTVVDGFIDLLYEDPTGADLVVLDFKTTNTSDEAVLRSRTKGYLLQGATYAYCVQRSTGRAVSRVEFAYLSEDDVVIHTVEGDELAAAIDKVIEIAQQVDQ